MSENESKEDHLEDLAFDNASSRKNLRLAIYALLIATSLGSLVGRIGVVESRDGRTPFLSANDRSRWCTIRSLGNLGVYEIDNIIRIRGWNTIDKVQHEDKHGELHFYSSKPTLFPTLLAHEYRALFALTGANIGEHPFYVARIMLLLTNGTILLLYFCFLIKSVERWGKTEWGRIFVMTVATWGTYLTTFGITLNNHLPAAVSALIATYCLLRIWYDDLDGVRYFVLSGLAAAFTAANELPALAFFAAVTLALLIKNPPRTFLFYAPAACIVIAGFFVTNRIAHNTWTPAYAHSEWYEFEGSGLTEATRKGIDRGEPSKAKYAFHTTIGHHGIFSLTPVWLLTLVGLPLLARSDRQPALALMISSLSLIVWCFYVFMRPVGDRNYGGVTSGLRWMFWFIPLWLLAMQPAVDAMAHRPMARWIATLLLLVSVASASYSLLNPWVHPWLYSYLKALGA